MIGFSQSADHATAGLAAELAGEARASKPLANRNRDLCMKANDGGMVLAAIVYHISTDTYSLYREDEPGKFVMMGFSGAMSQEIRRFLGEGPATEKQ